MPSKQTLVFGRASRLAWHLTLLLLAGTLFTQAYGILADLELHPYLCFVVPGAVCGYGAYATALFVAKDDRLADGVSRDAFVIWLYLFFMAPMLAKEMLPPLDVNGTAFAERGIVVEKGLVTNSDLAKVYKELWQDSGRRSVVPWALASLSSFQPKLRMSVMRRDFDHTGRVQNKNRRGKSVREYDYLQAKFWLPLTVSDPIADVAPDAPATPADDAAAAPEAKKDATEESKDGTKPDAAGEKTDTAKPDGDADKADADKVDADKAAKGDKADTADADNGDASGKKVQREETSAVSASFVYLFIRAAPKVSLWPQPELHKKKKQRKEQLKAPVYLCGKLFNGVPRGEPIDEEAAKNGGRDIKEDPNGLAFSFRADYCPSSDPWLFTESGWGAYYLLLPLYIAMRFFLSWFSQTHNMNNDDDDFIEEWRKFKRLLGELFVTASGFLGQHKVQVQPEGRKSK